MMKSTYGLMLLLASVLIAGCGTSATNENLLRITGSSTVVSIASKAAEIYRERYPDITLTVSAGGSGLGLSSVGQGLAEIGMMSRAISEKERTNYPNVTFKEWKIGRDAVAAAISAEVYEAGVHALSREQIRQIYAGDINNWKVLGGPDREIVCIDKEHSRGTRHVFIGYIFGDENAEAPGADLVSGSNNEEQTLLTNSNAAIGMLSLAWLNDDVKGAAIIEGNAPIAPTLENVRNGRYPISRDLRFVTRRDPSPLARDFIDFVLSPEGQAIVKDSGFIAVKGN